MLSAAVRPAGLHCSSFVPILIYRFSIGLTLWAERYIFPAHSASPTVSGHCKKQNLVMENRFIEKTIEIKAPLNKVWSVFINPDVTKQMGGYYDTDWKVGSSFEFKKTDGNRLTNGVLLEFQPEQLIKHSLYEPNSEAVMAVLTYEFQEKDDYTLLTGKEELSQPLDQTSFNDASEGWKSALYLVKQLAETL